MSWLRHPKTTQERREAVYQDRDESGVKCRSKRNYANIPNVYDDFMPRPQRSWKAKRKTKFR